MTLQEKMQTLENSIRAMNSIVIGFSGGVDSTFLLKVSVKVLGKEQVLAVTTHSEVNTAEEIANAAKIAGLIGANHLILTMTDLDNEQFVSNPPNRCYYCKNHRYTSLLLIAQQKHFNCVLDGANYSDLDDYRPGIKALSELGIRSPLLEAGLTKAEIRQLSKELGLPTWDQPARACLSSRLPYGVRITGPVLQQIATAEEVLRINGFTHCRVRHHDTIARIEVPHTEFARLIEQKTLKSVVTGIKAAGYTYINLDLEGYRMGSMNESLSRTHTE